jgi:putative ABC transport system permease protein
LLAPVAYGYYVLGRQSVDFYETPLLLLVTALTTLALMLLTFRMLPAVLWLLAWVSSLAEGIGLFLAARTLARRPALYAAPLAFLVLTLSLSIFAASLATTLNAQLYDRVNYETGADIVVRELAESTRHEPYRSHVPPRGGPDPGQDQWWSSHPVADYLNVAGVDAATRVGRYSATARPREGAHSGEFLGVDHWDFVSAAYCQDEFASVGLGAMMDSLAAQPDGVLVPVGFMDEYGLVIGDTLEMKVLAYGGVSIFDMKIVGAFEAFPSWSDDLGGGGSLFVGNLYHVFEQMGVQLPHDVWLRIEPDADHERVIEGVRALGVSVLTWTASAARIAEEQHRPERQGLFGVLSMGAPAAAFLTGIGLLQATAYALRRRFVEWGVLRAVGASTKQTATALFWELCLLFLAGAIVGTGLGVGSSHLFLSHLLTNDGLTARWPPLVVQVAWPTVVLGWVVCGLLFVVLLVVLKGLWLRIDASRAIISGGKG